MILACLFSLIFYHFPVFLPYKTTWYFQIMVHTLFSWFLLSPALLKATRNASSLMMSFLSSLTKCGYFIL